MPSGGSSLVVRKPRLALDAVPGEQRPDRAAAPLAEPRTIRRAGHDIDPIAPGDPAEEAPQCLFGTWRECGAGRNEPHLLPVFRHVQLGFRFELRTLPVLGGPATPASRQTRAGDRRPEQSRGRIVA